MEWPDYPALSSPVLEMDQAPYLAWRETRLKQYRTATEDCLVEVVNPHALSRSEREKFSQIIASNNFAIYQYRNDRPDFDTGY